MVPWTYSMALPILAVQTPASRALPCRNGHPAPVGDKPVRQAVLLQRRVGGLTHPERGSGAAGEYRRCCRWNRSELDGSSAAGAPLGPSRKAANQVDHPDVAMAEDLGGIHGLGDDERHRGVATVARQQGSEPAAATGGPS